MKTIFFSNSNIINMLIFSFLRCMFCVVCFVYSNRRKKQESELMQMLWRVKYDDIQFTKLGAGSMVGGLGRIIMILKKHIR